MVAAHLVKLACELPDEERRRSLSLWTCAELARTLEKEGVVDEISPQTVQRILESHRLKPWLVHHLRLRTSTISLHSKSAFSPSLPSGTNRHIRSDGR
jgi:hypothetical protein